MKKYEIELEELLKSTLEEFKDLHDRAIEEGELGLEEAEGGVLTAIGGAISAGCENFYVEGESALDQSEEIKRKAEEGLRLAYQDEERAEQACDQAWGIAYKCSQIINSAERGLAELQIS